MPSAATTAAAAAVQTNDLSAYSSGSKGHRDPTVIIGVNFHAEKEIDFETYTQTLGISAKGIQILQDRSPKSLSLLFLSRVFSPLPLPSLFLVFTLSFFLIVIIIYVIRVTGYTRWSFESAIDIY